MTGVTKFAIHDNSGQLLFVRTSPKDIGNPGYKGTVMSPKQKG